MSDGTIIFDTKIDESGAKQGYSKLVKGYKAQLKELEKEIKNAQGYSDELRKKIEKGPNKSGFEKSLAKNEDYIKQLRSEWDSLNSKIESGGAGGNNGTPEIVPKDTGSSLDKLKTKLKRLSCALATRLKLKKSAAMPRKSKATTRQIAKALPQVNTSRHFYPTGHVGMAL